MIAGLSAAACDSLLDVENVSFIEATDVRDRQSVDLWANGMRRSVQRSWDAALLLLSAASDELRFVGQFAYWGELDRGDLSDPNNTGLNSMWPLIASTEWFAGESIHVLDSLSQAGELIDATPLARVYLYGAIANAVVADVVEDYAPANLTDPSPPIGPENMDSFYDTAIRYATAGLALQPTGDLERNLLATRARARHALRVWERVRPPPADVSGGGLVSDSDAAADASAALAVDGSDWRFEFDYPVQVLGSNTAGTTNCLISLRFGDRYVTPTANNLRGASTLIQDPIDAVPDPSVDAFIFGNVYAPGPCPFKTFTVTSAREMHLIIAEDALARADTATFASEVNVNRTAVSLTDWAAATGVTARDMLIHERQTRLFMTGRRLADMYRFGIQSDSWDPNSVAATMPGTLYPIPAREIEANCYLNGTCG